MVAMKNDGILLDTDGQARIAPVAAGVGAFGALRLMLAWAVVAEPDTGSDE